MRSGPSTSRDEREFAEAAGKQLGQIADGSPSEDRPMNASLAAESLETYLANVSLGGGHPLMVVVPRDELRAVLDGYRRYLSAAVSNTIREGHRG